MVDRVGQQIGNYRCTSLVGRGGFADVYLAEHIYLKTQAAIKILHTRVEDDDIENFRAEAQTIAHLVHPHIIRVLDFEIEDHLPFLVMDYAPNGSLRQRHSKGSRLPPPVFLPYARQIAEALQYAHNQKLIHRDVKPENMLIGPKGELLLSDFGVALIAQSSRSLSTDETVMGTLAYMAPEQIQGRARPASDQYSLAVVVYEWIAGVRPFAGTYVELITQHLSTAPRPLEAYAPVPPAVEQVIFKALSKDYHQRFASVQEFAAALDQAYAHPRIPLPNIAVDPSRSLYTRAMTSPTAALGDSNTIAPAPQPLQRTEAAMAPARASVTPQLHETVRETETPLTARRFPDTTQVRHQAGRIVKRSLRVLVVAVIIGSLLLCGLGYLGFRYVTSLLPHSTTNAVTATAAAVAVADDFLKQAENRTYDRAYNDLGPPVSTEVSRSAFVQQEAALDRCYGAITQYTRDSDTTIQGTSEKYSYTLTRAKLPQTYQAQLTLQKQASGSWRVVDYNSSLPSGGCK